MVYQWNCGVCGHANSADSRHCYFCGTRRGVNGATNIFRDEEDVYISDDEPNLEHVPLLDAEEQTDRGRRYVVQNGDLTEDQRRRLRRHLSRIIQIYNEQNRNGDGSEVEEDEDEEPNDDGNPRRQRVIAIPLSSLISPLNEGFILLLENVPLVVLLLLMAICFRYKWIISSILLWVTLEYITDDFCQEFSLKDTIKRKKLFGYLCTCLLTQFIASVLLRREPSLGSAFYTSLRSQSTISGVIICYLVCDPMLQLFFLELKLIVGMLPMKLFFISKDNFYEKKRKLLAIIEEVSVICRQSFISLLWLGYYAGAKQGALTEILVLTYCSMKFQILWRHFRKLYGMLISLVRSNLMYGKVVSMQEAAQNGNAVCPICMDTVKNPTKLSCNHIFCEPCIAQWLETNQTCPICRRTLENNGYWIHASGSRTRFPFCL